MQCNVLDMFIDAIPSTVSYPVTSKTSPSVMKTTSSVNVEAKTAKPGKFKK